MFFSIIIPTCNRNKLLGKCLTLLSQQENIIDYEVIVSDDSISNIAKPFIEEFYPFARWVEGAKKGPAANRNNGAKFANGKWLIFLDDDCLPSNSIVFEYQNYIFNNPKIYVFEGSIKPDGIPLTPLDYAPINLDGGNLWSCNFCIKTSIFVKISGFDDYFKYPHLEDVDLHLRLKQSGYQIYYCSKSYVIHPWRRFTSGKKLALFNEMDFYFAKKHNKNIQVHSTFIAILNIHLSLFLRTPKIMYVVSAVKITLEHSFFFLYNANSWKKKYFNQ